MSIQCSVSFQGHVEQWIDFSSLEIDINITRWYFPRIGYGVYLPPVSSFCVKNVTNPLVKMIEVVIKLFIACCCR